MHGREMYAYEMHAGKVHSYEMYAGEVHAYEMHAGEVHAYEMHAGEVHAYEMPARVRYTPTRHTPIRYTPVRCTHTRWTHVRCTWCVIMSREGCDTISKMITVLQRWCDDSQRGEVRRVDATISKGVRRRAVADSSGGFLGCDWCNN